MKKKVKLELSTHEVESILCALNAEMENYVDDYECFMNLLDLKLKIRKEYEKCTLLD